MHQLEEAVPSRTDERIEAFMRKREAIFKASDTDNHNFDQKTRPGPVLKQLEMKADKVAIEKLNDQKSNRTELQMVNDRLSIVQKEVTHLLVLLNETLKVHLLKAKDTKVAKENRAY